MKTKDKTPEMSKRKQELVANGFHWVEHTREEAEANCPDPYRFRSPENYMTEEELKYFHSDSQRKLFVEQFWPKR
jgi:hypothetical protein